MEPMRFTELQARRAASLRGCETISDARTATIIWGHSYVSVVRDAEIETEDVRRDRD